MAFVAAAIGGAGLLSAGASIWAANKNSQTQTNAANQAAAIQAKGQADALGFQKDVFQGQKTNFADAQHNLNPFIQTGVGANNLLASAYGLNGSPALGPNTLAAFQASPDYQWALKGGSDALDNSAAAKGSVLSGNQIRAQTEYGSGLATQNLQNYFQRLSGLSQQGMTAGGYLGQMGSSLGNGIVGANASTNITGSNNVAQSVMGAGTAQAAGLNGMIGGFNGGLNQLSLYNQMNKSSFQPGGSSFPTGGSGFSLGGTGGLY